MGGGGEERRWGEEGGDAVGEDIGIICGVLPLLAAAANMGPRMHTVLLSRDLMQRMQEGRLSLCRCCCVCAFQAARSGSELALGGCSIAAYASPPLPPGPQRMLRHAEKGGGTGGGGGPLPPNVRPKGGGRGG